MPVASTASPAPERSLAIAQARRELIHGESPRTRTTACIDSWISRSWQRCIEAGANDYMAKPLDVEKLLSLVRVWMPK